MSVAVLNDSSKLTQKVVSNFLKRGEEVYLLSQNGRAPKLLKGWDLYKDRLHVRATNLDLPELGLGGEKLDTVEQVVYQLQDSEPYEQIIRIQNLLYFCRNLDNLKKFACISPLGCADQEREKVAEMIESWPWNQVQIYLFKTGLFLEGPTDGPQKVLEELVELQSKKVLLNTLKYLPLPLDKKKRIPFVGVDYAANCIGHVLREDVKMSRQKMTYQLIDPESPSLDEFIQDGLNALGVNVQIVAVGPTSKVSGSLLEKVGLGKIPKNIEGHLGAILGPLDEDKIIVAEGHKGYRKLKKNYFKRSFEKMLKESPENSNLFAPS